MNTYIRLVSYGNKSSYHDILEFDIAHSIHNKNNMCTPDSKLQDKKNVSFVTLKDILIKISLLLLFHSMGIIIYYNSRNYYMNIKLHLLSFIKHIQRSAIK